MSAEAMLISLAVVSASMLLGAGLAIGGLVIRVRWHLGPEHADSVRADVFGLRLDLQTMDADTERFPAHGGLEP